MLLKPCTCHSYYIRFEHSAALLSFFGRDCSHPYIAIFIYYLLLFSIAKGCPLYGVPERLVIETTRENAKLEEERLVLHSKITQYIPRRPE